MFAICTNFFTTFHHGETFQFSERNFSFPISSSTNLLLQCLLHFLSFISFSTNLIHPLKENADVDLIIYLRRESVSYSLSASTQEENKHWIVQHWRQKQQQSAVNFINVLRTCFSYKILAPKITKLKCN
jgi:hypothetical protein